MVEGKEVTVRACKRLGRGWAQPWLPSTSASTGWWGASTLRDVEDGVCGGKGPRLHIIVSRTGYGDGWDGADGV